MLIAISGTHFIGKSTLIEDFIERHTHYKSDVEPYYKLQNEKSMDLSLEPSLDSLLEQLDYSIIQLNEQSTEKDIIYDRCPVDFLAYAMCVLEQDLIDINESEVADKFTEIKEALNNLDLIVFLPIDKENFISYTEENSVYRNTADKYFKKKYRDEICDIFPRYGHPEIIELTGDRIIRIKKLESYLT